MIGVLALSSSSLLDCTSTLHPRRPYNENPWKWPWAHTCSREKTPCVALRSGGSPGGYSQTPEPSAPMVKYTTSETNTPSSLVPAFDTPEGPEGSLPSSQIGLPLLRNRHVSSRWLPSPKRRYFHDFDGTVGQPGGSLSPRRPPPCSGVFLKLILKYFHSRIINSICENLLAVIIQFKVSDLI